MAAAGSNSPHHLWEGKLHHQCNNNLIDNAVVRMIEDGGGKQTLEKSPSLPSPCKSQVGNGGGRILFPLWTED